MAGIGQHLPASERAVSSWNPSVQLSSMGRKANCDTPSYNIFPNVQSTESEKKVLSRDDHRLAPSTSAVFDGSSPQFNSSHSTLSHPSSLQHISIGSLNAGGLSGSSVLYSTAQAHQQASQQSQQDWHQLLASVSSGNSSHTLGGANEGNLSGPVVSSSSSQQQSLLLPQPQHHGTSNGFSSDMSNANSGSTNSDTIDIFRQQQIPRQQSTLHPSLGSSGQLNVVGAAVSSSSGGGGGVSGLPPPSQQFTKSVPPGIKKPTPLYSGGTLDPAEFPSLGGNSTSSNSRSFGSVGGGGLVSANHGSNSGVTGGLGGSLTASLSNVSASSRNYVTVMSRGATGSNEQAEFSIQQEDFPALPGSQNPPSNPGTIGPGVVATDSNVVSSTASALNTGIPSSLPSSVALSVSSQNSVSQTSLPPQTPNWQQHQQQVAAQHATVYLDRRHFNMMGVNGTSGGDQHSGGNFPPGASAAHAMAAVGPNHGPGTRQAGGAHGAYGSLPNGMLGPVGPRNTGKSLLRDPYGLLGLAMTNQLSVDPNFKMLSHGINLHELGINMNAPELHYPSFISPFPVECFGRPQDIDYPVTKEYHMAHLIRSRLPPTELDKKEEDTLFWLFYNCTGEDIQLAAAKELFRRDWRYHKQEQVWIAKSGSNFERLPNQTGERGQYTVFNPMKWERTTQTFTLYYEMLDNAPPKFPSYNPYNITAACASGGGTSTSSTGNTGH